jgi:hypothetical protein
MAHICAFNLEAMQYDVPNAFLNATLDRTLHVRTPDGFQDRHGQTLRLLRALYGLKEAPRIWAIHFQESLRKLGLHPVQGFPCLWMNNRIILFFYVDDIIILYHPDYKKDFEKLEQQLVKLYGLRQMGNIKWFLGIQVERVLASRQLYLIQDSFIAKDLSTSLRSSTCGSTCTVLDTLLSVLEGVSLPRPLPLRSTHHYLPSLVLLMHHLETM